MEQHFKTLKEFIHTLDNTNALDNEFASKINSLINAYETFKSNNPNLGEMTLESKFQSLLLDEGEKQFSKIQKDITFFKEYFKTNQIYKNDKLVEFHTTDDEALREQLSNEYKRGLDPQAVYELFVKNYKNTSQQESATSENTEDLTQKEALIKELKQQTKLSNDLNTLNKKAYGEALADTTQSDLRANKLMHLYKDLKVQPSEVIDWIKEERSIEFPFNPIDTINDKNFQYAFYKECMSKSTQELKQLLEQLKAKNAKLEAQIRDRHNAKIEIINEINSLTAQNANMNALLSNELQEQDSPKLEDTDVSAENTLPNETNHNENKTIVDNTKEDLEQPTQSVNTASISEWEEEDYKEEEDNHNTNTTNNSKPHKRR